MFSRDETLGSPLWRPAVWSKFNYYCTQPRLYLTYIIIRLLCLPKRKLVWYDPNESTLHDSLTVVYERKLSCTRKVDELVNENSSQTMTTLTFSSSTICRRTRRQHRRSSSDTRPACRRLETDSSSPERSSGLDAARKVPWRQAAAWPVISGPWEPAAWPVLRRPWKVAASPNRIRVPLSAADLTQQTHRAWGKSHFGNKYEFVYSPITAANKVKLDIQRTDRKDDHQWRI